MNNAFRSLGFRNRLGLRLVIASLHVGSVLSIFSTGMQLGASYLRQRTEAQQVLGRIEETLASSLEQAIWTFNFAQVNIILDGLSSDPNIAFVELTTKTDQSWTRGDESARDRASDVGQTYNLVPRIGAGQTELLGVMDVRLTLDAVRARVWAEFLTTFLTNLGKAYLAALALLFLVDRMISRHLRRIVHHVDSTATTALAPLRLDRPTRADPDDLDRIVEAVGRYERRKREQVDALSLEVKERELAEAEAREALSIRSGFLATMSHEIRTPLNAIMGFLHLIETYDGVQDKPRIYAQTATKASHQLMGLMNNSLDLSRIEANAVEIKRSETDLHSLARDWHQSAEGIRHLRGKDIDITLDVAPDLPQQVMMDAPHVTQIVSYLVDNAIKFTDTGRVDIAVKNTTSGGETSLDIRVSDTGIGIPEDARAHIFDRFTQADTGMLRAHGGSGLGLAICSELARLMGADLIVDDRKRDGFTTVFLLRLENVGAVDLVG